MQHRETPPATPLGAGALPAVAVALALAALLLEPAASTAAFTTNGGSLGLGHRDVRVFDNFTDPTANDNTTPHPEWPGYTGAEMAIWKGCAEWASEIHGLTGNGDPHQPGDIGSGGANFDPMWLGNATSVGDPNDKTHSEITANGGSLMAYTETPVSDGWRIRYYSEPWVWHDGPGTAIAGGTNADIQGLACHEYGHALGLDHSPVVGSTMFATINGTGVEARSIEADDQMGVQFIYGPIDIATKPHIQTVAAAGGTVALTGTHFWNTGNEIWFTPDAPGASAVAVKVTGVSSNGSLLSATLPAGVGPGDILVKKGGLSTHKGLSNAFPFDPANQGTAFARSVNIDIGLAAGKPGAGQGQVAVSPGYWNGILPPAANVRLSNLSGVTTAAALSNTGINGEFTFDNPNTAGGTEKLMDDFEDIGCSPGATSTWTMAGMSEGTYDVFVYAWAPDNPTTYFTDVLVHDGQRGVQTSGGVQWPGGHVEGGTYVRDVVDVAADGGSISVTATTLAGCGSINGIQVVRAQTCGDVVNYCTAGTSANGCRPTLITNGAPSASQNAGFTVTAMGLDGQRDAIFFWGTSGRQANSWGNSSSFQCVVPPATRGGLLPRTGVSGQCDGASFQDLNALWCATCAKPQKNPGPGTTVNLQCWYRDPFSSSNQTTALSDAIEFDLCP